MEISLYNESDGIVIGLSNELDIAEYLRRFGIPDPLGME